MTSARITELFGIRYAIVQAGMVWVAGQSSGLTREISTVREVFDKVLREYQKARAGLPCADAF